MILDWLAQDFKALFAHDSRTRVALWCDSAGAFQHLLPAIAERLGVAGLALLTFDRDAQHGALWLKWAAEMGPGAGKKVVVWLPYAEGQLAQGAPDGTRLDCLLEYVYSGLTWQIDGRAPTLLGFLERHGVPVTTQPAERDRLVKGGPDSLLAKYVGANLDRSTAFWHGKTLSPAAVEESVVGDLDERLRQFLAEPQRAWEALGKAGIAAEFASQVSSRYADTAQLGQDPEAWAQGFVTVAALLEVYEATGRPDDFPFASRLPEPAQRQAILGFLRHWMRDRDHLETYRRWAQVVDGTVDLRAWAQGKPGRPQALRSLAADRWQRFLEGLKAQGASAAGQKAYVLAERQPAAEEAKGFWAAATGDLPGWTLAVDLAGLIEHATQAATSATQLKTAARLADAYERDWHQVDLAHWRLLSAARHAEDMEPLAAVADRFYGDYLQDVGQAFYDAFRSDAQWPPQSCRPISELASVLYGPSTCPKAILVVDGLRFDLAALLKERLGEGTLEAYVANVPSETRVGMTSLLPHPDVKLSVEGGSAKLFSEAAHGDLTFRTYRWKLLEQAGVAPLAKESATSRRDSLTDLWELTAAPADLPHLLVLFDPGVDTLGHAAGHQAIVHFETLLGEVKQAIRKLQGWGYAEIHVVTDHGFLLLHSDANVQTMAVDKGRFALLDARYGFLKQGEKSPSAAVPFPLDPEWSVALPPGLRSFSKPGTFFHGGATLQEVVVPHLTITSQITRQRMRVRAMVPKVEIAMLGVKVELVPERPEATSIFEGEPEPIEVRVFLGTPDAPRSNEKTLQFSASSEKGESVTLFLQEKPPIPAGTEIPVQVLDVETGESYAVGLFVRAARDLG